MGLLKIIVKSLESRQPNPSPLEIAREVKEVTKDGRLHHRFPLPSLMNGEILYGESQRAVVTNVSYGGLGVEWKGESPSFVLPYETTVQLAVLGITIPCKVRIVRAMAGGDQRPFAGMSFCHDSPEVLTFLKPLIEGLRFGATLTLVPPSIRREHYQGPEWSCLRSEGPCDVLIKMNGGGMEQALFTFPWRGAYGELAFAGRQLATRETMQDAAPSNYRIGAQMRASQELNQEMLRRGAFILGASPGHLWDQTRPLLDVILRAMAEKTV